MIWNPWRPKEYNIWSQFKKIMKCFHVKSFNYQIKLADFKLWSAPLHSFINQDRSVFSISPLRILDG